jgi:uncharacterized protein (DUF1330 family)
LVILIGSGTGAFAQAATRPVYVIVERLTTTGPEDIQKRYGEISKSIVAKFGGRYLSRSQDNTLLEGPGPVACCMAIIEFPSSEAAQRWYASPEKSDGRKNPPEWGNIPHCDDPGFAPRKRPLVFANLIRPGQAVPGQPLRQEGNADQCCDPLHIRRTVLSSVAPGAAGPREGPRGYCLASARRTVNTMPRLQRGGRVGAVRTNAPKLRAPPVPGLRQNACGAWPDPCGQISCSMWARSPMRPCILAPPTSMP